MVELYSDSTMEPSRAYSSRNDAECDFVWSDMSDVFYVNVTTHNLRNCSRIIRAAASSHVCAGAGSVSARDGIPASENAALKVCK